MRRVLRIDDTVNGIFLSMEKVLAPLVPEAEGLRWAILDLGEAYLREGSWDRDLEEVEQLVLASPSGFELPFQDLRAFARATEQVIDGLFVGCSRQGSLPVRSHSDAEILDKADILVAAFDSTFWYLAATEPVLTRVEEEFNWVVEEDPSQLKLSAWDRAPDT
jgi:hypothetical protein